jgi:hypothetical protein
MFHGGIVALGVLGLLATAALGQDGSTFPASIESNIGDKPVTVLRTGTALRKKGIFKVYLVASYLQEGVKVRTAEELAASDSAKRLHLVFLRSVGGREMAQTFRSVLRQNYPEPAFAEELKQLTDLFERTSVQRGDHVLITHIPKVGLHCRRMDREEALIKNVDFSRAVWNNYFGPRNVSEAVKQGLVSELRVNR